MSDFELRRAQDKGEGVFAIRSFQMGEIVIVGVVDHEVDRNHSHASQVSDDRFVVHGGLIPTVNHVVATCEQVPEDALRSPDLFGPVQPADTDATTKLRAWLGRQTTRTSS